ncbi:hypothetical protein [Pannonibacter sp.]|uniref:hypothetical protein n=1 Tax=Pannonibacter sp. TaxID=1906786 RepID=UPI0039517D2C
MRASEPQIQTDFELERYIIEHRDPRDEAAPAAPHPAVLAMRYLFDNGHLSACGFTAELAGVRTMDDLADMQVSALRATLATMQTKDQTAKTIGLQRVS